MIITAPVLMLFIMFSSDASETIHFEFIVLALPLPLRARVILSGLGHAAEEVCVRYEIYTS